MNKNPYEVIVKVEVYPNDILGGGTALRLTVPTGALKAMAESGIGQLTVGHDDLRALGFSQIILSTDPVLDLIQETRGANLTAATGLSMSDVGGYEKHEGLLKGSGTSSWVTKYNEDLETASEDRRRARGEDPAGS